MTKKTSLADIANSLGVSKTLVSLVINNKAAEHGISQETQQRVRDKIVELNFRPNVLAQGFRTGKTRTIGLIVSDISNIFYARIARKIEDYAWHQGYSVVICSSDENPLKEEEQIRLLMSRKVDGLILSSCSDDVSVSRHLLEADLPHVLIDRTFEGMESPFVGVDNQGGARMATQHLLAQGMRKLAVISISPTHISTIRDRLNGFYAAMSEAGISVPDYWDIVVPFDNIEKVVNEKMLQMHQSGYLPEAIFALNNNLTSAVLAVLRKLALNIPHEVALIGFDEVKYYAFTQPSVSAIEQPVDMICEHAFDLLYRQITKKTISESERCMVLPVSIRIRESSTKTSN